MLAAHLLAEIAGTAGREGQRADVGMAGIKGRPQQCLTPVIHTLEQGPGAGAGASRAMHSLLTSPAAHGTSAWARGRERGGWRGEERGHGHQQLWTPEARYFPRSRQEANLSQALGWEVRSQDKGMSPGSRPAWFPDSAAGTVGEAGRRMWALEVGWGPAPASCARTQPHHLSASL